MSDNQSRPGHLNRRQAIGLLLGAAMLPPILGKLPTASAAPVSTDPSATADALRRLAKPNLQFTKLTEICNAGYRVTFWQATWDGGQTIVRDLEIRAADNRWVAVTATDRRFDEQWIVHRVGGPGHPREVRHWMGFASCTKLSRSVVELRGNDPAAGELVVRWVLDGTHPELQYTFTAAVADDFVISYQGFDLTDEAGVEEVLCGALQHAKVIVDDPQPRAAWELFTPAALTQRPGVEGTITVGTYIPAEVMLFEHDRKLGLDDQPYGMSLRNESLDVVPTVYAPQPGIRATMTIGQSRGFAFGLCARASELAEVTATLVREEYGLQPYRENVYGTSLTDTIHNIVDLVLTEPDGDDSVDFVPSFSGWWNRAKGFANVEIANDIRVSTGGVLLAASLLTSVADTADSYDHRARPMLEFLLSRGSIAYSPISKSGQKADQHRLGFVGPDALQLNALNDLTRGQVGTIRRLGLDQATADVVGRDRPRFVTALGAHLLTGDPSHLVEAETLALDYIATQIDTPYTEVPTEQTFGWNNSRYWASLVVLHEYTQNPDILAGAHREALRFITQTTVRPVPDDTVTVGTPPVIQFGYDWPSGALPDYPRTAVPVEQVPAWQVSTSGLTYEQLSTFKISTSASVNPGGGYVLNPCWAPLLLRLAHHTGDDLLADIAHNMVIGRFTNYPGYYNREFQALPMKPDFPLQGPAGISSIYPHHIPGQLGLAMDYLVTEQFHRSGGKIDFPGTYEANFVYFTYTLYGHRPGTFHGEQGVWPWIPRGIISVDEPAVNWLTGVGNSSLYVGLVNTSATAVTTTVSVASAVTGLAPGDSVQVTLLSADGQPTSSRTAGSISVDIPAHGSLGLAVRDVELTVPWHRQPPATDPGNSSHHSNGVAPGAGGLVRGTLLPRPDGAGYDAYVFADVVDQARFEYRIGDGSWQQVSDKPYPYEWTVPVADLAATFSYRVSWGSTVTDPVTLSLPALLGGPVGSDPVIGQVQAPVSAVAGAEFPVQVVVGAADATAHGGVAVTPAVPTGWVIAPATRTVDIPATATVSAEFTVTVPATAPLDSTGEITATATVAGNPVALTAGEVFIRDPRRLVEVTATPSVLTGPGQTVTVTAAVANPGLSSVTAPLQLIVPSGWQATATTVTLTVPPGEVVRHSFTATGPATANWGTSATFGVSLANRWKLTSATKFVTQPGIVHVESPWPAYQETGAWRLSGLAGWGGTRTKYSLDGLLGGTARWVPTIATSGSYEISVWWPAHTASTTQAHFVIRHDGGEDTVVVDQTQGGNDWYSLGTYLITDGTGEVFLEVSNGVTHRTSAVRWQLVDEVDPIATVIVDNDDGTPGYVEQGAWGRSTISGHNGIPTTRWIAPATDGIATWTPTLPSAGLWRVSVWYPTEPNNSQQASYTITTADGAITVSRDQRIGSTWDVLGTWQLDPATAQVVLTGADSGRLRADAVRFEQLADE